MSFPKELTDSYKACIESKWEDEKLYLTYREELKKYLPAKDREDPIAQMRLLVQIHCEVYPAGQPKQDFSTVAPFKIEEEPVEVPEHPPEVKEEKKPDELPVAKEAGPDPQVPASNT